MNLIFIREFNMHSTSLSGIIWNSVFDAAVEEKKN